MKPAWLMAFQMSNITTKDISPLFYQTICDNFQFLRYSPVETPETILPVHNISPESTEILEAQFASLFDVEHA
jgi:hypothetical protein